MQNRSIGSDPIRSLLPYRACGVQQRIRSKLRNVKRKPNWAKCNESECLGQSKPGPFPINAEEVILGPFWIQNGPQYPPALVRFEIIASSAVRRLARQPHGPLSVRIATELRLIKAWR